MSDLSPRVVQIRGPVETKPAPEHSTHAVILSIASGTVGFMSIAIAVITAYWGQAEYKQSHDISCVQFAQQMLQVAEEEEPIISSKPDAEQDQYVKHLFALFPTDADTDLAGSLFLGSSKFGTDTLDTITTVMNAGNKYTSGCKSASGN